MSTTYNYRYGELKDLEQLKKLGVKSWSQFLPQLSPKYGKGLIENLSNDETYLELLEKGKCFVCETAEKELVGMGFLVSNGNPTEIYLKEWAQIRFITTDPDHSGQGIGSELSRKCVELAREVDETTIALHTSEMMSNAMHIYEKLGFVRFKEIPSRMGKRYWLYLLKL